MTNIAIDGPNRNRWFTELKNGGSSMAMLNNQRVLVNGGFFKWASQSGLGETNGEMAHR